MTTDITSKRTSIELEPIITQIERVEPIPKQLEKLGICQGRRPEFEPGEAGAAADTTKEQSIALLYEEQAQLEQVERCRRVSNSAADDAAKNQFFRLFGYKQTLEQSIAKIDAYLAQGKKLCLFVGRTPKEPLPSDRGEAQANEIWVSLDQSDEGPAISADRVHLHFDFNQQTLVRKLKKRFDLIVVDFSVMKFLGNDFANRFTVMFRTPKTRMLFESSTGIGFLADIPNRIFCTKRYMVTSPNNSLNEAFDRSIEHLKKYRTETSDEQQQLDWNAFMEEEGNSILKEVDEWPEEEKKQELEIAFRGSLAKKAGIKNEDEEQEFARQQLKTHLEKTFAQVELIEDRPYPYQTNYPDTSYFIVSNPIPSCCCCQLT